MTAAASATTLQPRGDRLPQLDGLRAVAIGLVLVHHLLPLPTGTPPLGHVGVSLFFVLSGFLITRILLDGRGGGLGEQFKAFYARRALRILPPYFALLGVLWLVGVRHIDDRLPWHAAYLSNWLFTDGKVLRQGGLDRHLWSLSVEEQFYLVWPWLMLLLPRVTLPAVFLICIAGAALWRAFAWHMMLTQGWSDGWLAYTTPAHLDLLAIGGLSAFLWHWRHLRTAAWIALVAGTPFVVLDYGAGRTDWLIDWRIWFSQTSLALLLVGLTMLVATGRGRVLSWGPIVYVGTISYGMYLVHTFTGEMARRLLDRPGDGGWVVGLTACAMTFAIAAASWHGFERPILRLKRFVPYPHPRQGDVP